MPVLINPETGLAEDLPEEVATQAAVAGTHEIPLVDPQGNQVVAPYKDVQQLIAQGYSQPSSEQLSGMMQEAQYSSTGEQVKAALEGAASAATFGLSTGLETALGVEPEAIQARREINPAAHALGQIGGLAASTLLPGVGAGNLLQSAGKAAASAVGLGEAATGVARIGREATRLAAENALFQVGDQVSRTFSKDPNLSAETAVAEIGLASLLGAGTGAAFGAVPALWRASKETGVGKLLGAVRDRVDGVDLGVPVKEVAEQASIAKVELTPEMQAALSTNPEARDLFQSLQESQTKAGMATQEAAQQFRGKAQDAALSALGSDKSRLETLANFSEYDTGEALKKTLIRDLKASIDPISEQFEKVKERFKGVELPEQTKAEVSGELLALAKQKDYGLIPGSPEQKLVDDTLKGIQNSTTLESLRNVQSQIGDRAASQQLWDAGRNIRTILRNAEENLVESKIAQETPALLEGHRAAREGYRSFMKKVEDLNDRLRVGKYSGPSGFLRNLSEMAPEDILRRLTPKSDASLLSTLNKEFPEIANTVRQTYLDQMLKTASQRAPQGEAINMKTLLGSIEKMTPELRDFVVPKESQVQIDAIAKLLDSVPTRGNPSGTAKTLDRLWKHVPAGAAGVASLLLGHNPIYGVLLGELGSYASRELPDALKLSMLKYLGGGEPVNAAAFKASVQLADKYLRAAKQLTNSTSAVFRAGADVLPSKIAPTEQKRENLKKKIIDLRSDNSSLLKVGGDVGVYQPDHATALASSSMRAVQYLDSLMPDTSRLGPLDAPQKPSAVVEARYNRALDLMEQPLIALKSIKDGTLTPEDVTAIRTVYPSLYSNMAQQLTDQMIEHVANGDTIPYKTRLSLSLFLGQALDSTMTPQAIAQAQPKAMPAVVMPAEKGKGSMKALAKTSVPYQTSSQSREMDRIKS